MVAKSTLRSIGQVLSGLKGDFPDVSISKIRFLESEGLLAPQRAPSGYRRYSQTDVDRLRYILTAQRDQYLPLRVIREQLARIDAGESVPGAARAGDRPDPSTSTSPSTGPDGPASGAEPTEATGSVPGSVPARPAPTSPSSARGQAEGAAARPAPGSGRTAARRPPVRLSRTELLRVSGLSEAALNELELIQVIQPRRGSHHYGREALAVAVAAKRLAVYGIDSRHLRAFKMAADREIGLVEQAIAPHVRRSRNGAEVTAEVTQLIVSVHAALVRIGMDR